MTDGEVQLWALHRDLKAALTAVPERSEEITGYFLRAAFNLGLEIKRAERNMEKRLEFIDLVEKITGGYPPPPKESP